MKAESNPLRDYFQECLHWSLAVQLGVEDDSAERYLAAMLVRMAATDGLYAVKDSQGKPVPSVPEMLAYGDVRLKAESFGQEWAVHRHVGDFVLFWAGLFPERLTALRAPLLDPIQQARASYAIAGSFDHPPYDADAPVLRKLSERFDVFCEGLHLVRARFVAIG